MERGAKTWMTATAAGTPTMLGLEWSLRDADRTVLLPLWQGPGLWVPWPWLRDRPDRKQGLVGHSLTMLAIVGVVSAIRIVFELG